MSCTAHSRRAAVLVLAVALPAAVATGCGDGGDDRAGTVVVSAAASLREAFTTYDEGTAAVTARLSFAGSDLLAAQIRAGVRPDVFAAADLTLPRALHRAGLVDRPRAFAAGRLVLAVPAARGRVRGLADLDDPGVRLAAGSASVPVGALTRRVLRGLGPVRARAILANVRSAEPDVGGVVGKLVQGAVDAGFVYATDVRAAGGRLRAIALPVRLRPRTLYGVAVVRGAAHPAAARVFVDGLVRPGGDGQRALRDAGFEPPP